MVSAIVDFCSFSSRIKIQIISWVRKVARERIMRRGEGSKLGSSELLVESQNNVVATRAGLFF